MEIVPTKGQIEDKISKGVTKFYVKSLGVGPNQSRSYLLQDMIIIRLKGKLLPIEETLLDGHRGVQLVKDLRKALHEATIDGISALLKKITKHTVLSSHSDISTKTGEIVQVFVMDANLDKQFINKEPLR
ncbi:hypothetical protein A3C23_05235 [Candidatus Roizmanbacteria bacterium RIFCSPHIGHO2_02_FULL_37_13b]|uniref:Na+-translocating membrane potential-generating system MpsC domain-containing protein n=1 Tax=Candidatus Roizmanbacteria bacterium RIFCSPLOWO2_02_FULL_36_11 TaxID=1802071 RepID=A0A1F7JCL3_9BACT|nr:MAG: hypothetical protein A3C23_05235 [Candidatus Roizmanbacteria bacterium RIFCSPHIGHO2_02_FULL_37_13b]OGK53351.1 MAG: hypothetical protein A3H78_03555 [Candidatus Roizmanbacteria bacterium RIFCSPLOWO2_02_FULL_36_11]